MISLYFSRSVYLSMELSAWWCYHRNAHWKQCCCSHGKSHGISCGLKSGHPVWNSLWHGRGMCCSECSLHCISKSSNLDIRDPITIIFGRGVTEKVRHQTMLCCPTSPI